MRFIDHTGHIFEQDSYNQMPIGYDLEQNKYMFWVDDELSGKLSIDCYYIKTVRILVDGAVTSASVKLESEIFSLLSPKMVQDRMKQNLTLEINDSLDFKKELLIDDLIVLSDGDETMVPFYVICKSSEEATWTTQVLIEINGEYCPITVGGSFYDESEELEINGQNFGVKLPREILKAVYNQSFYSKTPDKQLYNEKLKEYLLNYMRIKGECGNFRSAIASLKWFGYGDKLKITHLLQTDNDSLDQYVRDAFNIDNDILRPFKTFRPSSLISLSLAENAEVQDTGFNMDECFYGEAKPVMEDLFDKLIEKHYDEQDITFYRSYYEWTKIEMAMKLACLRYFYKMYFLPIHLGIHSTSIEHHCFTNDIKLVTRAFNKVTEQPVLVSDDVMVKFPSETTLYLYTSQHYVDENYNELELTQKLGSETDDKVYYVNDLNVTIPIEFSRAQSGIYDCVMVLERDGNLIHESKFVFNKDKNDYKNFVIVPKIINAKQDINYWTGNEFTLHILCNGRWFNYKFRIAILELQVEFGKLEYKYNNLAHRQVRKIDNNGVDFQSHMWLPSLVDVENIDFPVEVVDYNDKGNMMKFIAQYRETPSVNASDKYWNRVHYYKLLDRDGNQIPYIEDENIINDLYKIFFNDDGTEKGIFNIDRNGFSYDMYLMHDDIDPESYRGVISNVELENWKPYWYIVFISRDTLDKRLEPNDDFGVKMLSKSSYKIEWQRSDKKFLINRMSYIPANGVNQFNTDDVIVGTINNIEMPFILQLGTKWKISPYSLRMENDSEVTSWSNTFIMGLGGDNTVYSKGYYDVYVRYSIDGHTQQEVKSRSRILVR